ncbi:unnamed protein product, partial [Rotaria sp. Silwood1]
ALIVAALQDYTKEQLLDKQFYSKHMEWFGERPLCNEIKQIAEGSYQKPGGYDDGIRGKGYIVNALEAALWAFWSDGNSFERGARAAVNLGDDTDTTAAIYGQLAGAYYGYKKLPLRWLTHVYAKKFMLNLSSWIAYEGEMWHPSEISSLGILPSSGQLYFNEPSTTIVAHDHNLNMRSSQDDDDTSIVDSQKHNKIADTCWQHSVSPLTSPTNKETFKYNNMIPQLNLTSQSKEAINEGPVATTNSNIHFLRAEECVSPVNSMHDSKKIAHNNDQHEFAPSYPQSITSTDERTSLIRNTLSRRKSDQDDRNLKLPGERRSSDANAESPENTTFLDLIVPQNSALISPYNANKDSRLIRPEQNYSLQNILACSQSSTRNSKDAPSALSTFDLFTRETSTMLDDKQCLSWSCDDVCAWIQSWGEIYSTYIDGFKRHNVDGYRLLHFVDNKTLREFGVESLFNRRVILNGIENLKKQCGIQLSSSIPTLDDYDDEFDGDFFHPLYLSDNTYPNTMSCILQPLQNNIHLKLYNRILKWLGPLPNDIDIDKIELIHNADLHRMFLQQIKRTERRQKQQEFQPNLNAESNPIERKKVLNRLHMLTQQVHHNRPVSVIRVWHG